MLCEEQGNYMDSVKYCGYCLYHYKKLVSWDIKICDFLKFSRWELSYVFWWFAEMLWFVLFIFQKKDASIKTIPAFKPVMSFEGTSPESSPEKNPTPRIEKSKVSNSIENGSSELMWSLHFEEYWRVTLDLLCHSDSCILLLKQIFSLYWLITLSVAERGSCQSIWC